MARTRSTIPPYRRRGRQRGLPARIKLDAFPFQHPDAPELSVSIPIGERIFGQGAGAAFDEFVVTIDARA